jgi:hypothetical protein
LNRYRGFLLPAVLIVVGLLFLLDNLGLLSGDALLRLASLWPLLLVIAGIQVILNHTADRRTATTAGIAVTVVALIGAVAYAALGPTQLVGSQHAHASESLNGLTSGTLSLEFGGMIHVTESSLGDTMFRADADYPNGESAPEVSLDRSNGTVRIQESHGPFVPFFGAGRSQITITLNDRVPWALDFMGGSADVRLDIGELHLTRLNLSGGARDLDAALPAPSGTVPIEISGGARDISLHGPKTAWRIQVSGGARAIRIGGSSFGGSEDLSQQSSDYDQAVNRYAIQVLGGARDTSFSFQ